MPSRKPLPPGRLGLPWLGETVAIARSNHGFYEDHFDKYGPIFKTRLFGVNFVVVSGAEAFHQFNTDPRIERGSTDPVSVEQIFLRSLALEDGDEHHMRKDVMLHGIRTREAINAFLPRMERIMTATIDGWAREGKAVTRPDLQVLAAQLSLAIYASVESQERAEELSELVADMRNAFATVPVAIPFTPYAKAIKSRDKVVAMIDEEIAKHQQAQPGKYDDTMSRMLAAAEDHQVPVDKLRGDLLHVFFASQGGYFVPLTLITLALGQHLDLQEKAREEVMAVAPDGPVTMEQIDRLQYLGQLSKELRRYFAMNSANFFGKAKEEIEIGGYRIPQGWGAVAAIHITMRSPKVYDDPDTFDPERFSPEREAVLAPGSYVPHGDGQRDHHRCPGEDIVTVAVKLYLVLLLRRLSYTLPEQDLTLSNELFPLPVSGLRADFSPANVRTDA